MKKANLSVLSLLILITFSLAIAPSESQFTYDFLTNSTQTDNTIHYTSSVLVTVFTTKETTCKYTTVEGSEPSNNFEINFGTKHEKVFENLQDGLHKVFIKCGNNYSNPKMELNFKTKEAISGVIDISEDSPLKAGSYDFTLITSAYTLGEPTLEFSLDNLVYKPLPLEGDGKTWRGHLIIEKSAREVVGSFRFKATDLDGKEGTIISGDKVFMVDTVAPGVVQTFKAIGYEGQVKLSWYVDEEVNKFRIYKSTEPGVDHTDFLDETDEEDYIDNEVTKGKTYYYRISPLDEAGNEGQMSIELEATALISNSTVKESGLTQKFHGKVDNLITELNLLKEDIQTIKSAIENKGEKEKQIFSDLGLNKEFDESILQLESLKKDVERFKLQDLSENELDNKLSSSKVKIEIIRKKVPESITIVNEKEIRRELSEEKTSTLTLEFGQETFTQKEIKNTITQTMKFFKETPIQITSTYYNIDLNFLDGTKKEKALIVDKISAQIERNEKIRYLLQIPKTIAETTSEISFQNKDYEVIKEDPLIGFDADIKEIKYSVNKHISENSFNEIIQGHLHIYKEDLDTGLMTGFSISNGGALSNENILYIILTLVILILFLYFIAIKVNSGKNTGIYEKIEEAKNHKKNNEPEKLKMKYDEIKKEYKNLTQKEKDKYFKEIKKLHGI